MHVTATGSRPLSASRRALATTTGLSGIPLLWCWRATRERDNERRAVDASPTKAAVTLPEHVFDIKLKTAVECRFYALGRACPAGASRVPRRRAAAGGGPSSLGPDAWRGDPAGRHDHRGERPGGGRPLAGPRP